MSKTIDLRGVSCPINYVKLKLELSKLKDGDNIFTLLDDGRAIDNVPNSLEMDGHEILEQKMMQNWWKLKIKNRRNNNAN